MRIIALAAAWCALATWPANAELRVLKGAEIEALLPTIVAVGNQTRQTFSATGGTTYTDRGRDSFGSWRVQGGRYCSLWPPSGDWSCFQVHYDPDNGELVWVGEGGHRTVNRAKPKN